jgi:Golgi phosphoprotein 3
MKLSIAEGLYLIALDDEEGRLLSAAEKTYVHGLLSAAMLELYILKKVSLKDGMVEVVDTVGTGNGVLDKILHKIRSGLAFTEQLEALHHDFKDIKVDLDSLLVHRGILKREETKMLWIPLSERMDNANYAFEEEIRKGLKAMVLKGLKAPQSFMILLSLIYDCKILEEVFPEKDDFIDAEKAAKDVVKMEGLDPEVGKVLSELRTYFSKL